MSAKARFGSVQVVDRAGPEGGAIMAMALSGRRRVRGKDCVRLMNSLFCTCVR
jgi:hypothetical protein